jgi:hypothetical protein
MAHRLSTEQENVRSFRGTAKDCTCRRSTQIAPYFSLLRGVVICGRERKTNASEFNRQSM